MKHKPKFHKGQVVLCPRLPLQQQPSYQRVYKVWAGEHGDLDGKHLYQLHFNPVLEAWGSVMFREKDLRALTKVERGQ